MLVAAPKGDVVSVRVLYAHQEHGRR
jgi:hypothetical protein